MNGRVIEDEHRIRERPLIHAGKETLDEAAEDCAGDCILDDLQVEDTVEGEGREDRIFASPKLEFVSRCTFTTLRPSIWPPQSEPVEVALIGENELLGAVVNADVPLEILTIILVSL